MCPQPSAGGQPALPNVIYITSPLLAETATRPRVVTPDPAIAESSMSPLGGGADSVREDNMDVSKRVGLDQN